MVFTTCDSLDENNYNEYDPDEIEDLKSCRFINYYLENIDMVGDIDMDRLRTVLKNDSYSNIEIIE